mmetsp:Transcript_112214/g.362340  ORF Transcript_112214/g.362340 Transcript_112214/m.362340 type:complete len:209 (+) Transcript_112214:841-1467(+)
MPTSSIAARSGSWPPYRPRLADRGPCPSTPSRTSGPFPSTSTPRSCPTATRSSQRRSLRTKTTRPPSASRSAGRTSSPIARGASRRPSTSSPARRARARRGPSKSGSSLQLPSAASASPPGQKVPSPCPGLLLGLGMSRRWCGPAASRAWRPAPLARGHRRRPGAIPAGRACRSTRSRCRPCSSRRACTRRLWLGPASAWRRRPRPRS